MEGESKRCSARLERLSKKNGAAAQQETTARGRRAYPWASGDRGDRGDRDRTRKNVSRTWGGRTPTNQQIKRPRCKQRQDHKAKQQQMGHASSFEACRLLAVGVQVDSDQRSRWRGECVLRWRLKEGGENFGWATTLDTVCRLRTADLDRCEWQVWSGDRDDEMNKSDRGRLCARQRRQTQRIGSRHNTDTTNTNTDTTETCPKPASKARSPPPDISDCRATPRPLRVQTRRRAAWLYGITGCKLGTPDG